MRKSSTHARKRGAFGKLRTLAHSVANSTFQQYIANPLLVNILEPFGISVRKAYEQKYGKEFTAFLLDGEPLPTKAADIPEGDGVTDNPEHGMVYA